MEATERTDGTMGAKTARLTENQAAALRAAAQGLVRKENRGIGAWRIAGACPHAAGRLAAAGLEGLAGRASDGKKNNNEQRPKSGNTMEIKGRVHEIGAVQQVTETFKKRDLIVVYAENPQYPEYLRFEAVQDRVAILDGLAVGDAVTVHFGLRGRPWTDKNGRTSYFSTLVARRVEKNGNGGDGLPF